MEILLRAHPGVATVIHPEWKPDLSEEQMLALVEERNEGEWIVAQLEVGPLGNFESISYEVGVRCTLKVSLSVSRGAVWILANVMDAALQSYYND